MADAGPIEEFIAKSKNLSPLQSQESTTEDWESVAPGVDPADYKPKDTPIIPPPPPPPPLVDTGHVPNPFSSSGKKDIQDILAEPGVCGLINLGNTCYMNSGLQSLRSIPQLAQFYLDDNHPLPEPSKKEDCGERKEDEGVQDGGKREEERVQDSRGGEKKEGEGADDSKRESKERQEEKKETSDEKDKPSKTKDVKTLTRGHVSARFSALVHKMWTGQFSAIVPQTFKTTLGLLYPQFSGYRQQDCQEFLVLLLDCLHEDIINQSSLESVGEESEKEGGSRDCEMKETHSVITDTFQGQLRNEVACSVCGHVSVKCDPFVYLSVPIPHSNEKQITVFWSSVTDNTRTVEKLLVIVPILGTVNDLKLSLCQLLEGGGGGGEAILPDNIIIAHVKDNSIVSTLGNALAVKHVVKDEFKVYAFHVGSPPTKATPSTTATPSREGYERIADSADVEVPMETDSSPRQSSLEDGLPSKIPRSDEAEQATPFLSEKAEPTVVIMEWHSCVICLEEMVDSDLLTHSVCGAMICPSCLQASRTHSATDNGLMPCPVCKSMVTSEEGFVPLAAPDTSEDIVRLLQLTVLFRHKMDETWVLFGHPCILNLPSSGSVDKYYQLAYSLLPTQCHQYPWSLALTDGKGHYCSRCLFGSGCRGCVLSNATPDISLKPGDFLSVSFNDLSLDVIQEANGFRPHPSLDSLWPLSVSLQHCLDLFSQKETLGQDNPWWCSQCKVNQPAVRQLMISQLPTALIVHLKRFLFHDNTASKVETGVNFPMSLSMPSSDSSSLTEFSLVSCVCHFGTLNSGHYTSYSKQPVTSKWYYYNDETVTEATPSDKDSESAYILFYHRLDSSTFDLPTEKGISFPTQEEELLQLEPLLRALKPKPSAMPPAPPPLPPIKKASSTGNLAADTSDNDIQLQQQIAASLGLDLPSVPAVPVYGPSPLRPSSSNPTLAAEQFSEPVVFKSAQFKGFDAL